jgi:hypothetical protein
MNASASAKFGFFARKDFFTIGEPIDENHRLA